MKRITKPQTNFHEIIQLGIKDINDCLYLDEIALGGLWNKKEWENELTGGYKVCLGIIQDYKLLAFVNGWIIIDELQINAICVHPKHLRKGIGYNLLNELLIKAKMKGCNKATLEVKESNIAAQELYKKIGFLRKGFRNSYYKDGSNAILQWKDLNK
tara:strand:+ start:290 stop:760 length:471 start_codon:yes stop_codon:yes gene_type:complete